MSNENAQLRTVWFLPAKFESFMSLRKAVTSSQPVHDFKRKSSLVCRRFILLLCVLLLPALACVTARAESLKAHITVTSLAPARVKVEGERSMATRAWSFRNIYAGVMNLGERIENLALRDAGGQSVSVRKLAPGEYEAGGGATRFSYEVKLDVPVFAGDAAHVSWLAGEHGFLMLGDLLPRMASETGDGAARASIKFSLPENWTLASSLDAGADGVFEIADAESAVFFVGRALRKQKRRTGSVEIVLATAGDWAFSDGDVGELTESILNEHMKTFGAGPRYRLMLALAPLPRPSGPGNWSAETRGSSVIFLSGKSPSKIAALSQLSYPLAHELFHLWVPNDLALDGNYDWFYEGFTLYQALRTAFELDYLTFDEYLNAVGRAFDSYKSASARDQVSLLDASERRWTMQPALVYNKGLLVAFLYDLRLRQETKGKRSMDDIYRELLRMYRAPAKRSDGNRAILSVLNNESVMREFTRRYIESASAIDLAALIAPFGLRIESGGVRTRLVVEDSLSGAQRDLLRKFGYNEKANMRRR